MSVGGIGGYHVGQTGGDRVGNIASSIGNMAFNAMMDAGTVAAGAIGGPAASAAMSSLRGGASGGGSGSAIDNIAANVGDATNSQISKAGDDAMAGQNRQVEFMRLQMSVNEMSQANTLVANMQKARHDAMMATIQNTR